MSMTEGAEAAVAESESAFKGIPTVAYIEDIGAYLGEAGEEVDAVIRRLEESHQKYKIVESQLTGRRARLRGKLPELKESLELVGVLKERAAHGESTNTRFLISDQAFVRATLPPTDKVSLWLGAGVMVEYGLEEAAALLTKNITGAEKTIKDISTQLDFLKDQTTTCEVNIARVYNYGVNQRKKAATQTAA